MSKHEYDPWLNWKRKTKNPVVERCGSCAHNQMGVCYATGIIRSVHPDDMCRWGKYKGIM